MDLASHYLTDVQERMLGVKHLGDRALAQLPANLWHTPLAEEGNSVAVLIQHLHGNMHSRWGAMQRGLQGQVEGESAGRNRDAEFLEGEQDAQELLRLWEDGWQVFLNALSALKPEDLTRTITIRAEAHTVLQAVQRQVAHYSGHVYQLVLIVKTLLGADFQTLSIPRGGSAAFNAGRMGRS